jgi:hypothetical protein
MRLTVETLVFYRGLRHAQTVRKKKRLILGWKNDTQTQGPKTIGHMNKYISMLDFTSVPAWIILYCGTAGEVLVACLQIFLKWYSPLLFFRIQPGSFGVLTPGPLAGKVC